MFFKKKESKKTHEICVRCHVFYEPHTIHPELHPYLCENCRKKDLDILLRCEFVFRWLKEDEKNLNSVEELKKKLDKKKSKNRNMSLSSAALDKLASQSPLPNYIGSNSCLSSLRPFSLFGG